MGFIRDEVSLRNIVNKDTERHLFEKLGEGEPGKGRPQDYKVEMLDIMEEFMKQISKQEEIQSEEQYYERTKNFGEMSTQENLPRKTQNQELPPPPGVRQKS